MNQLNLKIVLSVIIFTLFIPLISFSQTNPPTNLVGNVVDQNDVQLTWTAPSIGEPQWLHWDSGTNFDSFGNFIGGMEFSAAAKWTPDQISNFDGWNVTKMKVYLTSTSPTVDLKIWTGPDGNEQYSQSVTSFSINTWDEIDFDTPWTINSTTDLWAGLYINMPLAGGVMGLDAGPAVTGSGDKILYNGSWENNSTWGGVDQNWNIQIYVEPSKKTSTTELLGYNVYRDQVQLNTELLPSTAYLDENLFNGTYEYYVTAVYDVGESDPSNVIEILVDQPVILASDSLALVDLYNNCNGENWNNNENWLESPLIDWYGIITSDIRVTGITLNSNNLDSDIPESFGNLSRLRNLNMSGNDIEALPSTFGNLESLFHCWIAETLLDELPDNFGNLDSLETLSLSDNIGLTTLPASFGDMEMLHWLGIGRCSLDSLPSSFGNLENLYQFYVPVNQLTALPDNFGNLSSLAYLGIHNNQIAALPESFGDLPALIELHASENAISTLPESFGNISTLEKIYIDQNGLASLCDNFGDLSSLNFVRFSINNLTELPASFSNLASLEICKLDQNELTVLPEDIGNLTTLISLGLSSNNLTSLPESIDGLVSLLELYVIHNELASLPESIGNIPSVQILGLGDNQIETIPESIGNISSLGYLDLSENLIQVLPSSMGDLGADTLLIFSNQILEIPESMFTNDYQILWVDDNNLQYGSLEPLIGNVSVEFLYNPQGNFGNDTIISPEVGQNLEFSWEVTGEFNEYQWFKDGVMVSGQNSNTLNLTNITMYDEGIYTLQVTNSLVTEIMIQSNDLIIDMVITGVKETTNNNLMIYPNPATGNHIYVNSKVSSNIQILSISGVVVMEFASGEITTKVDISELPKGLYLVRSSRNDNYQKVERLIIN